MRVLYANHTGRVSGAERSLLSLVTALPQEVSAVVACPAGRLTDALRQRGVAVVPVRETDGSLRIHPLYSSRALLQIVRAALDLRREAKRSGAQLIHANSIRAGLAAVLAKVAGGPPVVVHLRDCLPATVPANITRQILINGASVLIANSRYTAANFARGRRSDKVVALHNPIDLPRFSPNGLTRGQARECLGLGAAAPVLGVIGQLAPWKAHDDAIRCLALLRPAWPSACLVLVGSAVFTSKATRYDNRAYAESLRRIADGLNLNGSVRFLGEREDIPEVLRALDLLLVPSWEEPFGRSVVEAMAMEVPVVATSVGGPAEVITDGVDGVLLPPRNPKAWAEVIDKLLRQPSRRDEIGRRARGTAIDRFGIAAHVGGILNAYRKALGRLQN